MFSDRVKQMTGSLAEWLRNRTLQNRYFIIRHGESEANVAGLIVSSVENGLHNYGLSDKGANQIRDSLSRTEALLSDTLIFCSDFKRTVETAAIVAECLAASSAVQATPLLRERYFGELEMTDSSHYSKVWNFDMNDPGHTELGVESVNAVLGRLQTLLAELEAHHTGKDILLVSHGDILQILQTAFDGVEASQHRSITHLDTAEVRALRLR